MADQRRPSFLLVLADDADAYKHEYARYMPTLRTRLVQGGTHLASHATEAALCGPARAALQVGQVCQRHRRVPVVARGAHPHA